MFYYLEGDVALITGSLAVIDIGGVGYACHTTAASLARLETGKCAKLYTYCNVREDAFDIFGFYTLEEKRCFELLLNVTGVGPKAALAILSSCAPEALALAVVSDDVAALTRAPGIGKKLAQRIILELKDKMTREAETLRAEGYAAPTSGAGVVDAHAALSVLGYSPSEISALLRKIDTASMTTEEIIREALRQSLKRQPA
ncbi:MAG: Holliday junction branch migration protein RuvA [Oscillospiraceae bacterium]|jgi:Holliday junction DNA helicase RuvA|nr:Holliday junction branch migration protein RuvA [Oscillospiraceae bacterium]